jgi:hypothetical protein
VIRIGPLERFIAGEKIIAKKTGRLKRVVPNKPNSRLQRYRITPRDIEFLKKKRGNGNHIM